MVIKQLEREDSIKLSASRMGAKDQSFPWEELYPEAEGQPGDGQAAVNPARVARIIGNAYASLHAAEGRILFFDDEERSFVRFITEEVMERASALPAKPLEEQRLFALIENVLVSRRHYDLAKIIFLQRSLNGINEEVSGIKLIRRNWQVVPWNTAKIEVAVRKSFIHLRLDSSPAVEIARSVEARLADGSKTFIHIEEVQDLVQEELMKHGYYKVAEAYILYRARREMLRQLREAQDEQAAAAPLVPLNVVENDGTSVAWDGEDLRRRIEFGLMGLSGLTLNHKKIERELRRSLYNGISRRDLQRTVVLNAKALMEADAGMNVFAGRLLLSYIYEEVLHWSILEDGIGALRKAHREAFRGYLERGVRIKRLNPQLLEFDIERLADAIDPSSDWDFDYLGIQTLYDRYLIVDKTGQRSRRIETPQFFWMRVAMGLCLAEAAREERIVPLYNLYRTRRFCSSTPTLFNSGTLHSQLSSCYLYWVDDSIEGIMQRGIAENAYLSKWAGGLGGSWTAVRGTGAHIAGTNGESQGVIPSSSCTTISSWRSTRVASATARAAPIWRPGTTTSTTSWSCAATPATSGGARTTCTPRTGSPTCL